MLSLSVPSRSPASSQPLVLVTASANISKGKDEISLQNISKSGHFHDLWYLRLSAGWNFNKNKSCFREEYFPVTCLDGLETSRKWFHSYRWVTRALLPSKKVSERDNILMWLVLMLLSTPLSWRFKNIGELDFSEYWWKKRWLWKFCSILPCLSGVFQIQSQCSVRGNI